MRATEAALRSAGGGKNPPPRPIGIGLPDDFNGAATAKVRGGDGGVLGSGRRWGRGVAFFGHWKRGGGGGGVVFMALARGGEGRGRAIRFGLWRGRGEVLLFRYWKAEGGGEGWGVV